MKGLLIAAFPAALSQQPDGADAGWSSSLKSVATRSTGCRRTATVKTNKLRCDEPNRPNDEEAGG